jgi:hypothetical protein
MRVNVTRPDPSKPCWVLFNPGAKGREEYRRYRLKLVEYEYRPAVGKWRKTGAVEYPSTLNKALAKADWVGRLPNVVNRRPVFNTDLFAVATPLFEQGLSIDRVRRALEREGTFVSYGTLRRVKLALNQTSS